ncbi:uncharacterized protein IL334_002099 [Kwoniella shivajii]|uniref:Histone-lysine N-methyltransferase ASH1L n=1 Tax=Kwoniella shivajii TaxID=564305 RepID=A0ABZ1CTS6_9TREE|nr:hypothetical protein IL334_002099 [Kwoniella shivajii]
MAPVKPTKTRTFFKSKLSIPIKNQSPTSKDKVNQSTEKVLASLRGPEGKSEVHNDRKQVTISPIHGEKKSGERLARTVKVYTSISKAKPKASVIIRKSSRSIKEIVVGQKTAHTKKVHEAKNQYSKKKDQVKTKKTMMSKTSMTPHNKTKPTVNTSRSSSKPQTSRSIHTASKSSLFTSKPSSSTSKKNVSSSSKTKSTTIPPKHKAPNNKTRPTHPTESQVPIERQEEKGETHKVLKKKYMTAGFYCQDPDPPISKQLVNKVLSIRAQEQKLNMKSNAKSASSAAVKPARITRGKGQVKSTKNTQKTAVIAQERPIFPPLPYDHGYDLFFGREHDFTLPYNIIKEKEDGKLDGKKRPTPFQKLRANVYPERPRVSAGFTAVCKCSPESKCAEQCINRIMSYLCGKECPAGDDCTNKTLTKRRGASYKVIHTGTRGFGIILTQDVKEGEFVIDYRGEVISMDTFMDRIQDEYKGSKNFYALEYDQDEVIDAGMRGNDARFINHGCAPNLEVRKYQTAGDGWDEFEVGMWALRDIKAGEELFYDYNFESFGVAAQSDELRTRCCCGAPNCVGFLGRKAGEKSAKELAAEIASKAAEVARKGKKIKRSRKSLAAQIVQQLVKPLNTSVLGLEGTPSITSASSMDVSLDLRTPSEDTAESLDQIQTTSISHLHTLSNDLPNPIKIDPPRNKRKSDVAVTAVTQSISTPKAVKKRRTSESFTNVSTSKSIEAPSSKMSRKSEPLPQPKSRIRIDSMSAMEAGKIKKAESINARRGAPRGWILLAPGEELPKIPSVQTVQPRRPPRDRSSLG